MTREVSAPAKINLGLEIIGRREDGYHDIRTILCAISLRDRLTFDHAPTDEVVIVGTSDDIPTRDNLVLSALETMRKHGAAIPPQRARIDKSIPAAAGLGGASSDAAAAIRAFAPEMAAARLHPARIATSLGSDVPFFLDGPIALATGRGEILAPLPAPASAWVVLATPGLAIPDKTRTMYAAVEPAWWSDGSRVDAIASELPSLPTVAPFNVFERALVRRYPEAAVAKQRLLQAGAPFAALTGAGPTWYTLVESATVAQDIAAHLGNAGAIVSIARLERDRD